MRPEILLVEDNPADARLIRELLREVAPGWVHVQHVAEIASARERLARGGVSLALIDLGLPGTNGLETIERLDLEHLEVPFVVLTGLDDDILRAGAASLGARDYLIKHDITGWRLVDTIRRALDAPTDLPEGVSSPTAAPESSNNVDDVVIAACERARSELGDIALNISPGCGGVTVEQPQVLHELVSRLLLALVRAIRVEGERDTIEVHTHSSGDSFAIVTAVPGEPIADGVRLLDPFVFTTCGDHDLRRVAHLLRGLGGQIRFDSRPGFGAWVEVTLLSAPLSAERQR